jgi:CO/xanthine dehydrogenase FAD-binding subunit
MMLERERTLEEKQQAVTYHFASSVEETVSLLGANAGEARIIAGGTDVLPDIRRDKIHPRCLIDITRIPGLDEITVGEEYVQVGAAVTFAALKESTYVNQYVHALAAAARSVGAQAIQNAATWIGNIVQAMPAADGAIIAIALDAEARIHDADGAKWQLVESLFGAPGISRLDSTRQFISYVRFPRPRPGCGTAWQRVGRRPSLVLPILNCAVKLCLEDGRKQIAQAALAMGPVAPRPLRARKAETFLCGQLPTRQVFEAAARLVQEEANPRDSIMRASRAYRLAIIPTLVHDALTIAAERARGTGAVEP